jgi:hypothetical protein
MTFARAISIPIVPDMPPRSPSPPKLLNRVRQAVGSDITVGAPNRRTSHGYGASSYRAARAIRRRWGNRRSRPFCRSWPLVASAPPPLSRVKAQHDADLTAGRGTVALPGALRAKYPNAPREWAWQWVFPATRFYRDAETGERRRHHLHESVVQRAVKDAVRAAGIPRPATINWARLRPVGDPNSPRASSVCTLLSRSAYFGAPLARNPRKTLPDGIFKEIQLGSAGALHCDRPQVYRIMKFERLMVRRTKERTCPGKARRGGAS